MDLDKRAPSVNITVEEPGLVNSIQGGDVLEPYVGMEFESEDAAKQFYVDYSRRAGFVVRVMQRRRSGIDGRTLARRLGCNKQGFSPIQKGNVGPEKRPRATAREGCNATILVKLEKSGKWVVSRFVKDHNHPLISAVCGFSNVDDKDKKIEELTKELQHQEELCETYRQRMFSLLSSVEEEADSLSMKVQVVVNNMRKAESELANIV